MGGARRRGGQGPITQTQRRCEPRGGRGKGGSLWTSWPPTWTGKRAIPGQRLFPGRGLPFTISAHPQILAPLEANSPPWRDQSAKTLRTLHFGAPPVICGLQREG